ncbi:adenylyltransferase/cytidyltransferase family protein [Cereibacter sphaeroides]|uniref:adenylyltransferase/cytidyltransferase family protein n=1 Tax=Cereibacter sphaeroides TaxID=1063 RepID=UPI003FCD6D9A
MKVRPPKEKIHDLLSINGQLENKGKIVCTSGGFDPLHCGHVMHLSLARRLGDCHVAFVNHDDYLIRKKGHAFMPLEERCLIVAALECVDFVVPIYHDTVDLALATIRPSVFAKGGDRSSESSIPEWHTCNELGIEVRLNVDDERFNRSSSQLLKVWRMRA